MHEVFDQAPGERGGEEGIAGGAALARHGAFSPDGAVQFATYGLELLWTLTAATILVRVPADVTAESAYHAPPHAETQCPDDVRAAAPEARPLLAT